VADICDQTLRKAATLFLTSHSDIAESSYFISNVAFRHKTTTENLGIAGRRVAFELDDCHSLTAKVTCSLGEGIMALKFVITFIFLSFICFASI
jgi:hypothetical protein